MKKKKQGSRVPKLMHKTNPFHLLGIQFLLFVFINKLSISVLGEREPGGSLKRIRAAWVIWRAYELGVSWGSGLLGPPNAGERIAVLLR